MGSLKTGPGPLIQRYIALVERRAHYMLVVWFLFFLLSAWKGFNLMKATSLTFTAPEGSKAAIAESKLADLFPKQSTASPVIFLLHQKSDLAHCGAAPMLTKGATGTLKRDFIPALNASVFAYVASHSGATGLVSGTGYQSSLDDILPGIPDARWNGSISVPPNKYYNETIEVRFAGIPNPIRPLDNSTDWAFVTMTIEINSLKQSPEAQDLVSNLLKHQDEIVAQAFNHSDCIEGWLTGLLVFGVEVQQGTEKNFLQMDMTALPLAMVVLMIILGAARLLIIPLINIIVSILGAFLIVWRVALSMTVISMAPSVMMSVMLAMSIDYSLFQLSRYREELLRGRQPLDAVMYMTCYAGHTILVSGSTLVLCFLSLMLFPSVMLQSMGLGCAIGLALAITVNLTLTPALLLGFPDFFKRCILPSKILAFFCGGCYKDRFKYDDLGNRVRTEYQGFPALERASEGAIQVPGPTSSIYEDENAEDVEKSLLLGINSGGAGNLNDAADAELELLTELRLIEETRWYRFIRGVTAYPRVLVAVLVGLAIPCVIRATSFTRTLSVLEMIPRDSEGTQGYKNLNAQYGAGAITPYYLITKDPPAGQVNSGRAGLSSDLMQDVLHELPKDTFDFINTSLQVDTNICEDNDSQLCAVLNASGLEDPHVNLATLCNQCCDQDAFAANITRELAKLNISKSSAAAVARDVASGCTVCPSLVHCNAATNRSDAAITELFLDFDPFRGEGLTWYPEALDAIDRVLNRPNYTGAGAYLGGGACVNIEAVNVVYSRFGSIVGLTAIFVLVWIGLAFRSVLIPLRAVVTIGMTISYVFAMAVWVYEYGALNWLGFEGMELSGKEAGSDTGALAWIVPVMCFSVLVGLGLDYDVFLISRIVEYRKRGLSNRAAIVYGTAKTGGIITAAGAIMAIAFAGLLLCGEAVLNETAFLFVFAVLVDTMIIRTMLVPSAMIILGDANWWPLRVPVPLNLPIGTQ